MRGLARYTGEAVSDVVNYRHRRLGPGPGDGLERSPPYGHARLTMHFVSNVDGDQLAQVLARVNPHGPCS